MKKIYVKPEIDVVAFNQSNIIATSTVPVGDEYETGTTGAPSRRNSIWNED